jgi:hypothetical protein
LVTEWPASSFSIHRAFRPSFAESELRLFSAFFKPTEQTRILDVGDLPRFWQGAEVNARITISNLEQLDEYEMSFMTSNQTFALGDATNCLGMINPLILCFQTA